MEVELAYGEDGLVVDLPDDAEVLLPVDPPPLADADAAIRAALRPWLASVHPPVVVVFPDLTRPFPHRAVLPVLLDELASMDVTLVCATGTHRQATDAEMRALIGDDLVERYAVHDHDAMDLDAHVPVGTVDGVSVLLDRAYVDARTRIVTGFVEPHFFAGFSGGPKAVCPGLAALTTVLEAHSPARIADPRATWLHLDGNPVHDFVRAATALAPPTLSLDVSIDGTRRLTGVWAAPLPDGHRAACDFVERTSVRRLARPADVVITTNAGYPLDRNLYQAVKGLAAAERVVATGGTVISAAACIDGVPMHGAFGQLLQSASTAEELLTVPGGHDQWQVQILGRVLQRARVLLHADGLTDDEIRTAHLEPVGDISAAVRQLNPERVCVLPRGPMTVASIDAGRA